MAKIATTIEQSQQLAEILPLESADMYWSFGNIKFMDNDYDSNVVQHIPSWSLAALLSLIPEVSLNTFKDGKWNAMIQSDGKMIYTDKDNPVDACYEMIISLHEQNLI